MKKFLIVLLLAMVILPACEKPKRDIEIPLPTEPPNIERMQPTSPPPIN